MSDPKITDGADLPAQPLAPGDDPSMAHPSFSIDVDGDDTLSVLLQKMLEEGREAATLRIFPTAFNTQTKKHVTVACTFELRLTGQQEMPLE